MTTIFKLIHCITRAIRRVQRRLRRRRTTVEAKITVALPPVLKIEVGMKSEPPPAANDNPPRRIASRGIFGAPGASPGAPSLPERGKRRLEGLNRWGGFGGYPDRAQIRVRGRRCFRWP